jgi:hypothetical protein
MRGCHTSFAMRRKACWTDHGRTLLSRSFTTPCTLILIACSVLACSTSATYATPSATCSDGARWERGTNFEYEKSAPTDAPACTPHCGPNRPASPAWGGAALTTDALPAGQCTEEGVVCTMQAEWLPPCPAEGSPGGPLDLFICRCSSGKWGCTIDATSPSATAWSCRMPDGSDFNRPRDAGGHSARGIGASP